MAGLHPRDPARAGLGLPARGRHPAGQRARPAAALEGRARPREPGGRGHRARRRLQGGAAPDRRAPYRWPRPNHPGRGLVPTRRPAPLAAGHRAVAAVPAAAGRHHHDRVLADRHPGAGQHPDHPGPRRAAGEQAAGHPGRGGATAPGPPRRRSTPPTAASPTSTTPWCRTWCASCPAAVAPPGCARWCCCAARWSPTRGPRSGRSSAGVDVTDDPAAPCAAGSRPTATSSGPTARSPGTSGGRVAGRRRSGRRSCCRSSSGTYELYFLFPLDKEVETLALVRNALLLAALGLVILVGGIAWLVTRQVVTPVRMAARIAERLSAGRLEERMRVRGEDDLARLAASFNRMATSLQRQIRQLEDLSRVQRRFVSDVSHELRTPLTTVRMAADVLHEARTEFDPAVERSAEILQAQLDRFEALLADLLEISRYDAGAAVLEAEPTDLRVLARHVIEAMETLAERKGSDLRLVEPGVAVRGRGRQPPDRAGAAQPGRQRDRARRGPADRGAGRRRRRRGRGRGPRPRCRARARGRRHGLQPVLAGRPGAGPHHRRHRAGPVHRAGGRPPARRVAAGLGRARRRLPVPAHRGPPCSAPAWSGPRSRWSRCDSSRRLRPLTVGQPYRQIRTPGSVDV